MVVLVPFSVQVEDDDPDVAVLVENEPDDVDNCNVQTSRT
jgi:hypothetical protein